MLLAIRRQEVRPGSALTADKWDTSRPTKGINVALIIFFDSWTIFFPFLYRCSSRPQDAGLPSFPVYSYIPSGIKMSLSFKLCQSSKFNVLIGRHKSFGLISLVDTSYPHLPVISPSCNNIPSATAPVQARLRCLSYVPFLSCPPPTCPGTRVLSKSIGTMLTEL